LRSEAQKRQKEDDVLLPQLEQGAKDANAWAAVGETHASKLSWGAAHAAFERALAMGGVRREAELRLHYGISLFKAGQPSAALAQWQAIQADPTATELAALWRLRAR
jgi:Tfp pilus assembly protein PilF